MAITVVGLRKSFGDHVVLDGIDLQVAEGSVVALLGPNGAGKTTMVQILSTLISADAGTVEVFDHDLAASPGRHPGPDRRHRPVLGRRYPVRRPGEPAVDGPDRRAGPGKDRRRGHGLRAQAPRPRWPHPAAVPRPGPVGPAAGHLGEVVRDDPALALQVPSDGSLQSLRALLDDLDRRSIAVEGLSVHTPDLDDVFLALTGTTTSHGDEA